MIDFELQKLIDSIDSDTDFEDELFFRLVETTDVLENAQLLAKIEKKCDGVGRGKEFETLLKGWKAKVKELHEPLPKPFEAVTANELMEQDLPPLITIIEDILKVGVCILSAKSKIGKSWLCLQMGVAVANGTELLGKKANKNGVLYLDYENDVRITKERLQKILAGQKPPENLYIVNDTPTLKNGFTELLEDFVDRHDVHLVIIDIFAKIKYQKTRNQTDYEADYKSISELKKIAEKRNLAIVLVYHNRKAVDDTDAFSNIIGSVASMGSSDEAIVIYKARRTDEEATISITGRTVESLDLKAVFDKDTCKWKLLGEAEEYERQKQIAEYENNPIVATVKKLVSTNNGKWQGRISEMISASKYFEKRIYDSPKTVSSKLKSLSFDLQLNDGISIDTKANGTAGKTYIFTSSDYEDEEPEKIFT